MLLFRGDSPMKCQARLIELRDLPHVRAFLQRLFSYCTERGGGRNFLHGYINVALSS